MEVAEAREAAAALLLLLGPVFLGPSIPAATSSRSSLMSSGTAEMNWAETSCDERSNERSDEHGKVCVSFCKEVDE